MSSQEIMGDEDSATYAATQRKNGQAKKVFGARIVFYACCEFAFPTVHLRYRSTYIYIFIRNGIWIYTFGSTVASDVTASSKLKEATRAVLLYTLPVRFHAHVIHWLFRLPAAHPRE